MDSPRDFDYTAYASLSVFVSSPRAETTELQLLDLKILDLHTCRLNRVSFRFRHSIYIGNVRANRVVILIYRI